MQDKVPIKKFDGSEKLVFKIFGRRGSSDIFRESRGNKNRSSLFGKCLHDFLSFKVKDDT